MTQPGPGEEEPGHRFSERFKAAGATAAALAATRAAMFREELGDKGAFFARAMAGFAVAAFFGSIALLIATALIAALLSTLFGSAILGVTATLALYLAVAAAGAILGSRALREVKPFDFPATRSELAKDLESLSFASAPPPDPEGEEVDEDADLEARYRAGWE